MPRRDLERISKVLEQGLSALLGAVPYQADRKALASHSDFLDLQLSKIDDIDSEVKGMYLNLTFPRLH